MGTFKTPGEYQYQTLRCNVDMLKIIQASPPKSGRNATPRATRRRAAAADAPGRPAARSWG